MFSFFNSAAFQLNQTISGYIENIQNYCQRNNINSETVPYLILTPVAIPLIALSEIPGGSRCISCAIDFIHQAQEAASEAYASAMPVIESFSSQSTQTLLILTEAIISGVTEDMQPADDLPVEQNINDAASPDHNDDIIIYEDSENTFVLVEFLGSNSTSAE